MRNSYGKIDILVYCKVFALSAYIQISTSPRQNLMVGVPNVLHSTFYTVSFYKALWTISYTSRGIGWGNLLARECVTISIFN